MVDSAASLVGDRDDLGLSQQVADVSGETG